MTPLGNPQNLYLYSLSGMGLGEFLRLMAPVTGLSLVLLSAAVLCLPCRPLGAADIRLNRPDRRGLLLWGAVFAVCLLSVLRVLHYGIALGAAVLAAAAIFAAVNYPAAVSASAATRQLPIYCVQRDQKVCSISFDAAWGADNTQKILDVLKEYGVTCTFFVVGNWADQYPEQAKAIVDSGNELMNHSNAHDHYNSLTADQIIADVNTCNDKIEALTGVRPTLIRCPFGEYDDHVISTIRSIGMEPIQWDVEALAAVGTARGASDMRAPYSSSCSGRCRSAGHSKKLIM